jgi:hypothetical protein
MSSTITINLSHIEPIFDIFFRNVEIHADKFTLNDERFERIFFETFRGYSYKNEYTVEIFNCLLRIFNIAISDIHGVLIASGFDIWSVVSSDTINEIDTEVRRLFSTVERKIQRRRELIHQYENRFSLSAEECHRIELKYETAIDKDDDKSLIVKKLKRRHLRLCHL